MWPELPVSALLSGPGLWVVFVHGLSDGVDDASAGAPSLCPAVSRFCGSERAQCLWNLSFSVSVAFFGTGDALSEECNHLCGLRF